MILRDGCMPGLVWKVACGSGNTISFSHRWSPNPNLAICWLSDISLVNLFQPQFPVIS